MMMPYKYKGSIKAACLSFKRVSLEVLKAKTYIIKQLKSVATSLQDNRGKNRKQLHRRVLRNKNANSFSSGL